MEMHYEILDERRKSVCNGLSSFKDRFYLAGGTGLALMIGHRESIDFDFFSQNSFDPEAIFGELAEIFPQYPITKIQEGRDTLTVMVNNVKVSFLVYNYALMKPLNDETNFRIAAIEDIGCMKLSAILSRSLLKDYVDLYFILKKISLTELLFLAEQKYPHTDKNLYLKSLTYFEEIEDEPLIYKEGFEVSFDEVKRFLVRLVKGVF